jgi:hypothetical protein
MLNLPPLNALNDCKKAQGRVLFLPIVLMLRRPAGIVILSLSLRLGRTWQPRAGWGWFRRVYLLVHETRERSIRRLRGSFPFIRSVGFVHI